MNPDPLAFGRSLLGGWRFFLGNLVYATVYWLVGLCGFYLTNPVHPVAAFWPAAGLGVAALVDRRLQFWPGLLAGGFALGLVILPSPIAAVVAAGAAFLSSYIGAILYRHFYRQIAMAPFSELGAWAVAAAIAPLPAAFLGGAVLWGTGALPGGEFIKIVTMWWAGDSVGILAVAPLLISNGNWRLPAKGTFQIKAVLPVLLVAAAGAGVFYFVFFQPGGSLFLFLVFPVIYLATLCFGGMGAMLSALSLTILIALAARHGQTPFIAAGQSAAMLQFEAFLLMVVLTGHVLAALHKEQSLRLPAIVLLIGWAVSGWQFSELQRERMRIDAFQFDGLINECEAAIKDRMETYINALKAGASLFDASISVSRDEWRRFAESLDLPHRYPGINGIGVILPIREEDKATFLDRYAMGRKLNIHPVPGARPHLPDPAGWDHFVVTYLEPEEPNALAIGVDFASEKKRQDAARISRDYGVPQMTASLALVQDNKRRPGFNLLAPIYDPDRPHNTVFTRRENFRGWIFAPFIFEDFFNGVMGNLDIEVSLQLFEGLQTTPNHLIFQTGEDAPPPFIRTTVLHLGGRQFTCGWTPGPQFQTALRDPLGNAASLALIPLLLAGLVTSLQLAGRKANEIVDERTRELREVNDRLEIQIVERQTAEKEAQAAREAAETANNAKSDFLATMSHEIRTPMNGVIGYTELLTDSNLTEEQRGWADNIQSSGRTLLALINDILDFSKIEAGKLSLECIPFDPLAITREVISHCDELARAKDLPLHLEHQGTMPGQIVGDPVRFKQVLLNLLGNAIKFTESGSIQVSLDWSDQSKRLTVRVTDTGLGIPTDKRDHLFERFSQVDSSTTRRFGGTGLGLAICKHLVELMEGTISVQSTEGVGTSICFDIPAEPAPDPAPAVIPKPPLPTTLDPKIGEGKRVLVAEDVGLNQKLAITLLTRLGCTVEIAGNGKEAIEKAASRNYDIIFMDCQMPIMDGYEAAKEIRRTEKTGHIPIVALTANALEGDRDKCLGYGMDDYISKPFAKRDFIRTLTKWSPANGSVKN